MSGHEYDNGLRDEIEASLNRYSIDNATNTPDFILSRLLLDCLKAYDNAVNARDDWFRREPESTP